MFQGLLIDKAIGLIAKQFKLEKILNYVEEDNNLDIKVRELEKRLNLVEKMAHPEKEFVRCEQCKCKVEECGEGSLE
jgi:uncharacterized protein with PIN domain